MSQNNSVVNLHGHSRSLQESVEELRVQRAALVSEVSALNEDVMRTTRQLEKAKDELKNEVEETQKRLNVLRTEDAELRKNGQALKISLDASENRKRSIDNDTDSKQRQLIHLEREIHQANSTYAEMTHQVNEAEELWKKLVSKIEKETTNYEQLKIQVSRLEAQQKESSYLKEELTTLLESKKKLDHDVLVLRQTETEYKSKSAFLQEAVEQARGAEQLAMKNKSSLELDVAKLDLQRSALENKITNSRSELEIVQKQYDQLFIQKSDLAQDVQTQSAQLTQLNNQVERATLVFKQKDAELNRTQNDIEICKASHNEVRIQVSEREKRVDMLTDKLSEIHADVRAREASLAIMQKQENELAATLKDKHTQRVNLENLITELTDNCRRLTSQQAEMTQTHKTKEEDLLRVSRVLHENQEVLKHLENQKFELNQLCAKMTDDVRLARENKELVLVEERAARAQVKSQQDVVDALRFEAEEFQRKIAELGRLVTDTERIIFNKNEEVQDAQHKIHALQVQIEHSQNKLQEWQNAVDAEKKKSEFLEHARTQVEKQKLLLDVELENRHNEKKKLVEEERLLHDRIQSLRQSDIKACTRIDELSAQEDTLAASLDKKRQENLQLEAKRKATDELLASSTEKVHKQDALLRQGTERRTVLAMALKQENDALMSARLALRSLEEMKEEKLRDIQSLREEIDTMTQRFVETRSRSAESQNLKIRGEAERTLHSLRKRIENVLKNDPTDE